MKGNKMKLINLIGKAFILLGIIMMASSYASYEKNWNFARKCKLWNQTTKRYMFAN